MESQSKYSTITIREKNESKKIKVTSEINPEIQPYVINKWQSLLDTVTKIVKVPSGLIMKLNEDTIEVFLKSNTEGNPYEVGEKAELIFGLYCETVIGTQKELIVPDATKSSVWKDNNPDIDLNMISYLGYPITWPDGVVFGTVCLLDCKENHYTREFQDLLLHIKEHIEADLHLLMLNNDLKEKNELLTQLNNTKSRFLSLISHDVRGSVASIDELLKLILQDYNEYEKFELKEMICSLSESASSTYLTLENLLMWSKNDFIQIEPYKKDISLIDIIHNLLHDFRQELKLKELEVITEFYSSNVLVKADKDMLIVVVRNLMSNAIKYTHKGGRIFIRVYKAMNKHIIEMEDTGVGMDAQSVEKLFTYNKSHKLQGTKGESSSGIGLMLVKEFLDKHKAEVDIESEVGRGTKVMIKWP